MSPIDELSRLVDEAEGVRGRAPGLGRVQVMISLPPPVQQLLDRLAHLRVLSRSITVQRLIEEEAKRLKLADPEPEAKVRASR